jgi:hypothetical protein
VSLGNPDNCVVFNQTGNCVAAAAAVFRQLYCMFFRYAIGCIVLRGNTSIAEK